MITLNQDNGALEELPPLPQVKKETGKSGCPYLLEKRNHLGIKTRILMMQRSIFLTVWREIKKKHAR